MKTIIKNVHWIGVVFLLGFFLTGFKGEENYFINIFNFFHLGIVEINCEDSLISLLVIFFATFFINSIIILLILLIDKGDLFIRAKESFFLNLIISISLFVFLVNFNLLGLFLYTAFYFINAMSWPIQDRSIFNITHNYNNYLEKIKRREDTIKDWKTQYNNKINIKYENNY